MNSAIKWHGGKHYLATDLIAMMPKHTHYVEPYFGAGHVLFSKNPENVSEVVNDLHADLTTFWRVLAGDDFPQFLRVAQATPFSEIEYDNAIWSLQHSRDAVEYRRAVWFFIACRQSMAGRMKGFSPLSRTRTRRGMNEQAASWLSAVEGMPEVHARLKRVVVRNRDACEVIAAEDGDATLFYLDPPYLHETRTAPDVYALEMTREQHAKLLNVVRCIRGKVMLSGYRSELYDTVLKNWNRKDFELANHSASGVDKHRMTECVWSNF